MINLLPWKHFSLASLTIASRPCAEYMTEESREACNMSLARRGRPSFALSLLSICASSTAGQNQIDATEHEHFSCRQAEAPSGFPKAVKVS